jgi:hypothetical protein
MKNYCQGCHISVASEALPYVYKHLNKDLHQQHYINKILVMSFFTHHVLICDPIKKVDVGFYPIAPQES